MVRVGRLGAALFFASAPTRAFALELTEAQQSHVAITVPDSWSLRTEGPWALAEAPDHLAHVRLASHSRGLLADLEAEAYLVNFVAETWATYTIDRHVRRVICGRFTGLELYGHGAGDGWDHANFHLFMLVDPQNVQRGVVVLITGRNDAWDAVHPVVDRAVHALH
jgi:hypothetical protein